jgi:rare lipoprotein A
LRATWYGPGFYGKRTACGKRLGRQTLGVAHRTLPCGTRVTFYHGGRFMTVAVIDRGPFARGVEWDLTAAAAKRLGFRSTGALRSVH